MKVVGLRKLEVSSPEAECSLCLVRGCIWLSLAGPKLEAQQTGGQILGWLTVTDQVLTRVDCYRRLVVRPSCSWWSDFLGWLLQIVDQNAIIICGLAIVYSVLY